MHRVASEGCGLARVAPDSGFLHDCSKLMSETL